MNIINGGLRTASNNVIRWEMIYSCSLGPREGARLFNLGLSGLFEDALFLFLWFPLICGLTTSKGHEEVKEGY